MVSNIAQKSAVRKGFKILRFWLSLLQVPTTTNVTLNGTVATVHVFSVAGPWEQAAGIFSEVLGLRPQGKHLSLQ